MHLFCVVVRALLLGWWLLWLLMRLVLLLVRLPLCGLVVLTPVRIWFGPPSSRGPLALEEQPLLANAVVVLVPYHHVRGWPLRQQLPP